MTRTRWITVAAGLAAGLFSAASACPESACPTSDDSVEKVDARPAAAPVVELVSHDTSHNNRAQRLEHLKLTEHHLRGQAERARVERAHLKHAAHGRLVEIINVDNDDKYEIVIKDGNTVAKVNGIRVADDLVKTTDDGRVVIYDDEGDVIKEIALTSTTGQNGAIYIDRAGAPKPTWSATAPGTFTYTMTPDAEAIKAMSLERPTVMMGVLLESPSDALRAHLDLPKHALVLEKVMKGLPAGDAGLKQWDIVVEVNGESMDEERVLHYALMESKPGDDLDVVVIRKGDEREVTLELVAYDSKKLSEPKISVNVGQTTRAPQTLFGTRGNWNDQQAQRSIEQAMREVEKLGLLGSNNSELSKKLREQFERMRIELEDQAGQLERARAFTLDDNGRLIIDREKKEEMVEDLEDRLEEIEERLEDQLEEIEERMEDRWERMEEVFERVFERVEEMLEKDRD